MWERDGRMTALVELSSQTEVYSILKATPLLKGEKVYVDRDLTADSITKRKAMLQLRKRILEVNESKLIKIRGDRMVIDKNEYYWKEEKLCTGGKDGKEALFKTYNQNFNEEIFVFDNLKNPPNSLSIAKPNKRSNLE